MRRLLVGILIGSMFLSSCVSQQAHKTLPVIVVTFSVLGDVTQNIIGDVATIETLVGPDSDTHAYEPRPLDSTHIRSARAVVEIGLGFEPWLDELYTSAGSTAQRIIAADGVTTHRIGDEVDPHVWHDVTRTIQMVRTISARLQTLLPEARAQIITNTDQYLIRLTALDQELRTLAQSLAPSDRVLVTSHDTFGYFAEHYGFSIVGTVFGASTGGADPSARTIASLVDTIRVSRVKAVFVENISNPAVLERVATEAQVSVAPPLYTDALGTPGSNGATYIEMMRTNMRIIVSALRGTT